MVFLGAKYQDEIFAIIDPEYVPKEFGGTCEWELPKGGPIPDYNLKFPVDDRDWQKVTVPRSDKFCVSIEFSEPLENSGTKPSIAWEFKTGDYDIEFSVIYSDSPTSTTTTDLIPKNKVSSYITAVIGKIEVEKPGLYQLTWDNTYSWTRSKKLEYILTITGNHKLSSK